MIDCIYRLCSHRYSKRLLQMTDTETSQPPNPARIAMTVLGLISVAISLICGLFLLYYGLSVQGFPTVGPEGGPTAELLIAFTLTGVGALLTSFSLFAGGVSFALIKIL